MVSSTLTTKTTSMPLSDPSQSAEDAARDGVLAAVAVLPLELRSKPLVAVDSDEGTWLLSRPSEDVHEELGDTTGDYGIDFISPFEYGELLLMSEEGEVEKAYPMPAFPPSWLLTTAEAVYVGRIGDGGLPWSAIGRIDRDTLQAEFIIFPGADAQYDHWPPDWTLIPDDYDQEPVAMVTPPTDSFVPAGSWIGEVYVDVGELERLFAAD